MSIEKKITAVTELHCKVLAFVKSQESISYKCTNVMDVFYECDVRHGEIATRIPSFIDFI